ncbi:glycoside hydrolase family 2 TIM barrel-domain containing protein [Occultella kanbiaonis]|uniref:glycoside hydrolase family 2 TIM barrel-domain containing protein n=1 Tax=Occultella kanbiaonis TaxID=2675754 RepID=UPI0012B853D8|nr:glycoside hydrolase family 2 TIM barrel-domain containing protein [Occultella kanbiaonis]
MQTTPGAPLADLPTLPGTDSLPVPLAYHDDPVPGAGRRRPRAQFGSDAARLSLNGDWAFTLAPTAAGTGPTFTDPDLDDGGWGRIDVPSHWVLRGHGDPLYTNTAFPFPIAPPHTPTANPTGDYRRTFTLPAGWRRDGSVLRFQGVDSCAAVWLNGVELGHSKGSRLPFEFDIGPALREGSNVLCVRVHRWSSGSYLEDQDMWWLPGIFRDVELLERPAAVDDVHVHADYDHRSGAGTLRVEATDADGAPVFALIDVPELGVSALPAGTAVRIDGVQPWSAEVPRLYRGTVRADGERIEVAIGFRTISVADGVLRVNGVRVHLRGVNRHEHDPDHGRALSLETMRRDILMMKAHNINAVRTSHYPPHPEFLRLCDELGLWVVDESDIETHGFIYAGWEGNPPDEPAWTPALLDRTARMVERDKNHPSVIIWSLGNESEGGAGFVAIEAWLRDRDPSRPLHYERDRTYAQSDFYSLMYPSLEDLAAIAERTEETPEALAENAELEHRRRALPFLLCEYAHAMGNGPGSLADYQEILESSDRMAGAFVWEWIDHGFRGRTPDGVEYLRHGGDIDYRPNGGSYCIDGLVRPDRVPSPGLLELAKVLEPVRFDVDADAITVRNHYDVLDTGHLAFTWELARDGVALAAGDLTVPVLAPGEQARVDLPAVVGRESTTTAPGEVWLTVSARLAHATPWADAGHEIGWGQGQLAQESRPRTLSQKVAPEADGSAVLSQAASSASADPGMLVVGAAVLDARTGDLLSLGGLDTGGLRLDIWRAPTENDRGQGELNNLAKVWRAVGLDRMLHSVTDVGAVDGGACVRARLAPATQPFGLDLAYTWTAGHGAPSAGDPGDVTLTVDVTPYGPWHDVPYGHHEVTLPRLGVRLGLPAALARATWFGLGPGESYVDSHTAAKVGRYSTSIDDLGFEYLVPQETGNRHRARWLELTGAGTTGLRVAGAPTFDFTARRWSTEALDAARHPHELRPEDRLYLHLDLAQHGLGSSSCGPATPDRYRVHPEPTRFSLTFSTPSQKEQ